MTLLDKANQVAGGIFFNIINNYPKPVFKLKKKKCYRPDKIFWSPDCDTLPTVFIHSFVGFSLDMRQTYANLLSSPNINNYS